MIEYAKHLHELLQGCELSKDEMIELLIKNDKQQHDFFKFCNFEHNVFIKKYTGALERNYKTLYAFKHAIQYGDLSDKEQSEEQDIALELLFLYGYMRGYKARQSKPQPPTHETT